MNNFHAVGRIAAEIKLQKNEKGVVYTRFPLAISRGKNKDGENHGDTESDGRLESQKLPDRTVF